LSWESGKIRNKVRMNWKYVRQILHYAQVSFTIKLINLITRSN